MAFPLQLSSKLIILTTTISVIPFHVLTLKCCNQLQKCTTISLYKSLFINPFQKYPFFTNSMSFHVTWIPWNVSFRYNHSTGQFTPKMNANAIPRLLSSLVWIDQYNDCNGMTSFMESMKLVKVSHHNKSILAELLSSLSTICQG